MIGGETIAKLGLRQFRCAETEKYPHVTFFFNDYRDEPFAGVRNLLRFNAQSIGGGEQVYFHAASADVLERELARRARRQPAAAALRTQVSAMNRAPGGAWLPWILSLPFARSRLLEAPSNLYFHRDDDACDTLHARDAEDRTDRR